MKPTKQNAPPAVNQGRGASQIQQPNCTTVAHIHTGATIDADLPHVLPGEYHLTFVGYRTWLMFGRCPKLVIAFAIAGDDAESLT